MPLDPKGKETQERLSGWAGRRNGGYNTMEPRRYCEALGFPVTYEIVDRASGGGDDWPGLKHLVKTLSEFEALSLKFIATHDQVSSSVL